MTRHIRQLLIATICVSVPATLVAQRVDDRQYQQALARFIAGEQALESEHYDVAETEFRAAVKIDPLFDAAFYGLGQVYMRTKQYEKAVTAYTNCRAAFNAGVDADKLDAAAADRRLRDQIRALEDNRRILERTSRTTGGANVAAGIDRINIQIRDLEVRRNRTNGEAPVPVPAGYSMALGSAYFRLNQLADAEREYKAAIDTDPKFGEAHNNLAVVYMLTNRIDLAEEEVKAAEKAGFKVSPQFKDDLKSRKKGSGAVSPARGGERRI